MKFGLSYWNNKIFLIIMHRKTMYTLIISLVTLAVMMPAASHAVTPTHYEMGLTLVPADIRGEKIYQTNHVVLTLPTWKVKTWDTITISDEWGDEQLYIELWDNTNHRIPNFNARRLTDHTIDISSLDTTLHPSFRIIIFQAKSPISWPTAPVLITYTEEVNTRLITLATLIGGGVLLLLILSLWRRVTPAHLWSTTKLVLKGEAVEASLRTAVSLIWITILWSAVFSIALGSFTGWYQILFLFIKLPFLLLCSLLLSIAANVVFARLLGVTTAFREISIHALQWIAVCAISLAALAPIIGYASITHFEHDAALLWALVLFGCAYCISIIRQYSQYLIWDVRHAIVLIGIWMLLYGVVLLQLGWMLRPWVGVLDPVYQSLPFSRLYSGNVFEEILSTINRL